jgi:hypothetical protein
MTVSLSSLGGAAAQFFDNSGNILSGGKIYTYAAGTTTPQTTYTSSSGSTAHTNPIILDSAGRVPGGEIWLTDPLSYKFTIQNSTNVLIVTLDNIYGIANNSALLSYEALIASSAGSSYVGYLPAGTNAVATTVQAKLRQTVNVKDFGAVGNNSTNDYGAIQAAINFVAITGGVVLVPSGNYRVNSTLTINASVMLMGTGPGASTINVGSNDISVLNVTGGTFSGAQNLFLVGYQNAAATAIAVVVASNIPALFRDCFIWGGDYAFGTGGVDGYYENVDFAGSGASGNIISTGANWYVRCKIDQTVIASSVGFYQSTAGSDVKENHFIQCDFSGLYTNSIQVNDTVSNSLMIFESCIFSKPCVLQKAKWVAFNSCEFAGGSNQFQIAAAVGVVSISNSYAFSTTPTPTGAGTMKISNNYSIGNSVSAYTGSFTYNLATASGTQVITGVGFTPKLINFFSSATPAASWGVDDGITPRVMLVYDAGVAGAYASSASASIALYTSAGNFVIGRVSAFSTDGFTITWTKTGSTSGTATINYSAV